MDVDESDGTAGSVRGIANALPALLWTTRDDGASDFANRRWREYTGLRPEQALDFGWRKTIHPDDVQPFLESWNAIRRSGVATEIEARLRRFDGEYRWFVFRPSPLSEERADDRRWCWLGIEADETATDPARPLPDGRLRRFLDTLPTQVVLMTPDLHVEFVNRRVLDFYGMSMEELKRWHTSGSVYPDDIPDIHRRLSRLVTLGEDFDGEPRMRRADGTYRHVHAHMVPSRDAHGNIVRYCSVQNDVEELKQAQALLAGEVQVLEMVGRGKPLRQILDAACHLVEELCSGCFCSVLIVAPDRKRFQVGAGPSLPKAFNDMLDGQTIDAGQGPCSLAVVEKTRILTGDPVSDPRWDRSAWSQLMKTYGYARCWSTPITSGAGEVSGTFTIYRRSPTSPSLVELDVIDRFTKIVGIAIDRAQSDEAVQAGERNLRSAHAQLAEGQRLSATGSFTSDVLLDHHTCSEECRRIFELDPGTPPSLRAARDRVHPDDLGLFDAVQLATLEGRDADFNFRILTPTAGLKYLRIVARVIDYVEARPIFMGTVQDVTEGKLAEAALKAREADLRQAYSYLTEAQRLSKTGSFTWDVLADEHNWSEEIYRIFGFELDAKANIRRIQAAIHPDDTADVERVIGGAAEGRDFDLVFRILTSDGEVRHAHVVGHRIERIEDRPVFLGALQDVTESKDVVGHRIEHIEDRPVFLGALQDVTESMLAEAALRASEAELRRTNRFLMTAQRLSKTGSFIWDPGANERQWSEEMYRIFEQAPDGSASSAMPPELIHPEDFSTFDALRRSANEGREFDGEFRLLMPSGKVKNLHVVGNLLSGCSDEPVFVGAAQDVTELKLREDALNTARAELAHVARVTTLSTLTASIAHEVSQPLSGILTNANTCLRMLAAERPNLEGVAETARRTVRDTKRATEVIKRLRALFARKAPTSEPVDLNEAAREVIALTSSALQRSRVIVQTEFADDLPTVHGDRIQLQQVILNLVMNAADAMAEVEGRQRIAVVQTHRDRGEGVELSVRDAGPGIDPQTVEKLFEAFYTTKAHGMGVGLSISRSIVESHEGRLWASANDGPGATFAFSIPYAWNGAGVEHSK